MNDTTAATPVLAAPISVRGRFSRAWDSDLAYSFRHSPVAMMSAAALAVCLFCAFLAPWVAPHNPFDLTTLHLPDALLPPSWEPGSKAGYLLGTN